MHLAGFLERKDGGEIYEQFLLRLQTRGHESTDSTL